MARFGGTPLEEEETEAAATGRFGGTVLEDEPPPPPPEATMKQVAPGVYLPSDRSIGDYITGAAEVIGTVGSAALAEPVSGLAGLAVGAIEGAEAGAETVEGMQEAMTVMPESEVGQEMMEGVASFMEPVGRFFGGVEEGLGEATLEATGSPALAAAAHAAPTALMEVLGLGILRKPSKAAEAASKAQARVRIEPDLTPQQAAVRTVDPEERSYQAITEDLKRGKTKDLAEQVMPDEEIVARAEQLGIDLNPDHTSTNEAFQRVMQAVKSQPGSELEVREINAIRELGQRADEMIEEFGGSIDKSLLDTQVNTQMLGTIKDLGKQSDTAYKAVADMVPAATKVNPRASTAYINQRVEEMGGDLSGLSTVERRLHSMLNPKTKKGQKAKPPTYARLDQLRKDIGDAYNRQGPFKDDASGTLDQVYGSLIRDQQGVADGMGAGPTFAAARKLVRSRKNLEKAATSVFGRDLNKSLIPKLTQAATSLTKGDVSNLKNLMDALPPAQRRPAAVTLLNDIFTHGARKKGSIGQGFASAYEALNRNPGAKAELMQYLPDEAADRFEAIGIVSGGIYRAKALENTSRTAPAILQALESGGLVKKISGAARPVAWLTGGAVAGAAADAVSAAAKTAKKRAAKADDLMASPAFNRAIQVAAEGRVKEAEIMLKRSKVWQAFRGTLGEGTKAQLVSMGPIAWMTQQQQPPTQPPPPEAVVQPPAAEPGMAPATPPIEALQGVQ